MITKFILFINLLSLSALFLSCIIGFNQFFGLTKSNNQFFKITGQFYNPTGFALFIASVLPFSLLSFLQNRKYLKFIACIILALSIILLVTLQIRSAFIGICGGAIFFTYYFTKNSTNKSLKIKYLGLIITPILLILYTSSNKTKIDSANGRIFIWKVGRSIFDSKPITGIGYGNLEKEYMNFQAEYFKNNHTSKEEKKRAGLVRYIYNDFFQILIEQGVIGFILFILFIYYIISHSQIYFDKNKDSSFLKSCFLSSIIIVLVSAIFSYPFEILPIATIFFVNCGVLSGLSKKNRNYNLPASLTMIILILILSINIFIITKHFKQMTAFRKIQNINYLKNPDKDLKQIYYFLQDDINFLNYYCLYLFENKRFDSIVEIFQNVKYNIPDPTTQALLAISYENLNQKCKAEKQFIHTLQMMPHSFVNKYRLAKFYFKNGCFSKSNFYLQELISQESKVASEFEKIIRNEAYDLKNKISKLNYSINDCTLNCNSTTIN